jgi:hypothetical protein
MRKKLYTHFFVVIAIITSVVNCYATSPHQFLHTTFQESLNTTSQNIDEQAIVTIFKPSINITNELFIIEEIPVEEFEEKEESLLHNLKKSIFTNNSSAILFRILFDNASSKTIQESLYQKTFATNVALHLYQKFEVYRI